MSMVIQAMVIRVEWNRKDVEYIRGTLQSHNEVVRAEPRRCLWAGERGVDRRSVLKGK